MSARDEFERVKVWATAHIEELAGERGIVLDRSKRAACVLHAGDGRNLSVQNGKGFHCFVCDEKGNGVELVRRIDYPHLSEREGFIATIKDLAPLAGVSLPEPGTRPFSTTPRPRPTPRPPIARPTGFQAPAWPILEALRADGCVPQEPPAVYHAVLGALTLSDAGAAYLTGRGFDPEEASEYGFRSIGGAKEWRVLGEMLAESFTPDELEAAGFYGRREPADPAAEWSPPWRHLGGLASIVLPYWHRSALQSLRFRAIVPDEVRYQTLKGVQVHVPFNADDLDLLHGDVLHIVEGELNAYALTLHGQRAIGLSGAHSWRPEWTPLLEPARRVVAWFDNDKPKQLATGKTILGAGERAATKFSADCQAVLGAEWVRERLRLPILPRDPRTDRKLDLNDYHHRAPEQLRARLAATD
jgi:hypothetical protein